jgi:hypothetical protein
MPITLDGTAGITNDATDLNYTGTLTGGTGVINIGSGQFYKDASGNVGIGVTGPEALLSFSAAESNTPKIKWQNTAGTDADAAISTFDNADGTSLYIGSNFYVDSGGSDSRFATDKPGAGITLARSGLIVMSTNTSSGVATERARIDSSGRLLVGKTSAGDFVTGVEFQPAGAVLSYRDNAVAAIFGRTNNGETVRFNNNGNAVGNISTTGSATAYNTSSDYRLKHDIQPMTGALAKVAQLKPVTYKWNADDSQSQGFIAHELQEVVPECVTGEKDAVDAEGKPVYQGIDTSFLVATLTAALQEAVAEINSLKARVEALEGATQ